VEFLSGQKGGLLRKASRLTLLKTLLKKGHAAQIPTAESKEFAEIQRDSP